MIEPIPHPGNLEVFVEIDDQVAKHVHRQLRSLRPGGHHALHSGDHEGVSVRQSNRFVMKAGYALSAALMAIGVNAARLQLLGNAADVGFADDISCQIQFPQHLLFMGAG